MRSWAVKGSAVLAVVVVGFGGTMSSAAVVGSPAGAARRVAAPGVDGAHRTGAELGLAAGRLRDGRAVLGWAAAHQGRSARLVDRSLLPARAAWTVAVQGGSSTTVGSFVEPTALAGTMPDVTHDGVDDVFQVDLRPRRYLARDGATGRLLWQRDARGLFDAEYARLGAPARPALLAQTLTAVAGVDRLGVVAIDARTGRDLWSSQTPGVEADQELGSGWVGDTVLAGATPQGTGADQVVVGSLTGAAGLVGAVAAMAPATLDGATGALLRRGLAVVADDVPSVSALGDVTGDGVGDVAVTANGSERQAALYDGATGTRSWLHVSADGDQSGSFADVLPRADAGRPAVLVTDPGIGPSAAVTAYTAAGRRLWGVTGTFGSIVAASDGDRVPDLVGVGFVDNGFEVDGISGRTGKVRYRSDVSFPPVTDGGAFLGGGFAGDLTGDGVSDLLFALDVSGSHPVHEVVLVDGRTGARHVYKALAGVPLGARLGGRGDALLDVTTTPSAVTVTARTLQQHLWSQHLAVPRVVGPAFLDYGRLTSRTRTTDVLLSLYGSAGSDIVAVRGSSGQVLWRVHVS